MSEMQQKSEEVVDGHQYNTDDDMNKDDHNSSPNMVSQEDQTSGSNMTYESTGGNSTDFDNQNEQNTTFDDDHYDQEEPRDTRPARPTKQDTLVGC
ncbi:hypothetical protein N7520_003536 [Penicillium odoratum]|uniref:uncharacterized protein n=1 Tax=Penicillium odoratum TaxID=1167516 RepID=UPI002547203A|nr:uncharacterized protein N7520_003536 [Penicillium odoratum]KAJ5768977.1 hypothetical protein N7520_003536 [Penicillium odoratum]